MKIARAGGLFSRRTGREDPNWCAADLTPSPPSHEWEGGTAKNRQSLSARGGHELSVPLPLSCGRGEVRVTCVAVRVPQKILDCARTGRQRSRGEYTGPH